MDPNDLLSHIMDIKENQAATHQRVLELKEDHAELKTKMAEETQSLSNITTRVAVCEDKLKLSTRVQIAIAAILPAAGTALYFFIK